MEKYFQILVCFCYFQSITLALEYYDKPELFQIYINGKQLNVVDDTLRLIHGTEANLSCIYRNATYGGKWKVGQGQVQSISPEWIAGFYGTYHRNPIFTKSVQLNHAGDISCIAMGHRRNLTVNVLYPPENASITGQDVIKIDDHLELTCLAYANPMPSFTWIEDGPTFGNGSTVSISREGDTMSFVCNVQNRMVPTVGDAVFSPIRTARKSVRIEVSGNGGLIAVAIIGWIVAVVVSSLAIAKYLRERGVITKLQTDLARYKKTELSKPLIPNARDSIKKSSDEYRIANPRTPKASQAIQLSKILESDDADVTLSPPVPPERPAETLHTEGKPQPPYLDIDSPDTDDHGIDDAYEDVEKRPVEQRYDDLDESAMSNTRQTDGYEEPIQSSRKMDSALASSM